MVKVICDRCGEEIKEKSYNYFSIDHRRKLIEDRNLATDNYICMCDDCAKIMKKTTLAYSGWHKLKDERPKRSTNVICKVNQRISDDKKRTEFFIVEYNNEMDVFYYKDDGYWNYIDESYIKYWKYLDELIEV